MVVTRRLNDVITRFTLHGSREPFAYSDCKNARLRGNDKLHFQCLLAFCLYRDTTVFLVFYHFIHTAQRTWGHSRHNILFLWPCARKPPAYFCHTPWQIPTRHLSSTGVLPGQWPWINTVRKSVWDMPCDLSTRSACNDWELEQSVLVRWLSNRKSSLIITPKIVAHLTRGIAVMVGMSGLFRARPEKNIISTDFPRFKFKLLLLAHASTWLSSLSTVSNLLAGTTKSESSANWASDYPDAAPANQTLQHRRSWVQCQSPGQNLHLSHQFRRVSYQNKFGVTF